MVVVNGNMNRRRYLNDLTISVVQPNLQRIVIVPSFKTITPVPTALG